MTAPTVVYTGGSPEEILTAMLFTLSKVGIHKSVGRGWTFERAGLPTVECSVLGEALVAFSTPPAAVGDATCIWVLDDDGESRSDCGLTLSWEDDPRNRADSWSDFKFCQKCGRRLEWFEADDDEEAIAPTNPPTGRASRTPQNAHDSHLVPRNFPRRHGISSG